MPLPPPVTTPFRQPLRFNRGSDRLQRQNAPTQEVSAFPRQLRTSKPHSVLANDRSSMPSCAAFAESNFLMNRLTAVCIVTSTTRNQVTVTVRRESHQLLIASSTVATEDSS